MRAAGSGSAKTAFPATSSVAPASRTAFAFASPDAAVDLDRHIHQGRELRDPAEAAGMNGWPGVPRLDAHAENHAPRRPRRRSGGPGGLGAGIERDADREPVGASGVGHHRGSSVASTWKVTESPPDAAISGSGGQGR